MNHTNLSASGARGWYGEGLYAISDHFLARECGFLHMNSISIPYRHYGNLWFGHMEVLCHPFTYLFFYHIGTHADDRQEHAYDARASCTDQTAP